MLAVPRVLVIDNYDSFVYNLVQYLGELGAEPVVHRHDAVSLDEMRALEPDAVLISPGPGRPADAGLSNEAIRAFGETGTPVLGVCLGLQCIGELYGGSVVRAPRGDARQDVGDPPHGRRRVRRSAQPVHRDAVPLARRRARQRARRARDHRRVRGRARHGPAPPGLSRSRACSSTPSRSSPTAGTACSRTSCPRRTREVRAPARDLGQTVVEQRSEHLAVELGGRDRSLAQARHHHAPPFPERAREAALAVLRLLRVRAARRARRRRSGSDRIPAHARCTPSRRGPSSRAAGRAARGRGRARARTSRRRGRRGARRARVRTRGGCSPRCRSGRRRRPARPRPPRCSGRRRGAATDRRASRPRRRARPTPRAAAHGAGSRGGPTR